MEWTKRRLRNRAEKKRWNMFEFFKIRGLYCLLAALTILFSASTFCRAVLKPTGFAPGDIMQAYVHFWDAGDNDFYPAFTIEAG